MFCLMTSTAIVEACDSESYIMCGRLATLVGRDNSVSVQLSVSLVRHAARPDSCNGYYGVTDIGKSITNFAFEVRRSLLKWLGRRVKRKCHNIEKFNLLLRRFPFPHPRIMVNLW